MKRYGDGGFVRDAAHGDVAGFTLVCVTWQHTHGLLTRGVKGGTHSEPQRDTEAR